MQHAATLPVAASYFIFIIKDDTEFLREECFCQDASHVVEVIIFAGKEMSWHGDYRSERKEIILHLTT